MIRRSVHVVLMSILASIAITGAACRSSGERPSDTATAASAAATDTKSETSPATAQGKTDGHAPAIVKPGSYEDWCEEHQVPESLCTRCNPTLIAAFKATGDWCDEHGLPESQCTICNPNLRIERPAKTTKEG